MGTFNIDNLNLSPDDLFRWIIETPQGIAAIIQITLLIWQLHSRKKLNTEPVIVGIPERGKKKNVS